MDTILWSDESDAYTNRAIEKFGSSAEELIKNLRHFPDKLHAILLASSIRPTSILVVGCSCGAATKALADHYPHADVTGIDPGVNSIRMADKMFASNRIVFKKGYSHQLPFSEDTFDLVVFGQVLQWIPRCFLTRTVAETDRILHGHGHIAINEFLPPFNITSVSHHNQNVYIFKNNYSQCFTGFPFYQEIYHELYDKGDGLSNRRTISVIKKYPSELVYQKVPFKP